MTELAKCVDLMISERETIARKWTENPEVVGIFKRYEIGANKFLVNFGLPIIDFFISVVKGEQKAGDCPIMSKLVTYLLAKHIMPRDVFLICMGFRRELIDLFFAQGCQNMRQIMAEIATLFNTNLAGVLDIFEANFTAQRQQVENLRGQDKKFKQILKIINAVKAKIAIVQEGKTLIANQPLFEAIGVKNLKELHQKYPDQTWGFVKAVDTNSELFFRDFGIWVKQQHETGETFKIIMHHAGDETDVTFSGMVTELPETEPVQYVITMYNVSEYVDHDVDEHAADEVMEEKDEVSVNLDKLPSYAMFEPMVKTLKEDDPSFQPKYAFVLIESRLKGYTAEIEAKIYAILRRISPEETVIGSIENRFFGVFWKSSTIEESYNQALRIEKFLLDYDTYLGLTFSSKQERVKSMVGRTFGLTDSLEAGSLRRLATDSKDILIHQEAVIVRERIYNEINEMDAVGVTMLYEELPVNVVNPIVKNEIGAVTLMMDKKQVGIMQPGATVYLLLDQIGYVKGTVEQTDRKNMRAIISRMRLEPDSPLRRKSIRVEAPQGMEVLLRSEETVHKGVVVDLNERSLGLKFTTDEGLRLGKDVNIQTELAVEGKLVPFTPNGLIRRIHRFDENEYVVVVECMLEPAEEEMLKTFVVSRQMEIIKNMRRLQQK